MIRLGGVAVVPQCTQVPERPEGHDGQNGVEDRGDDAHDVQPGRERVAGCGQEVATLGDRLETRKLVERAKGLLMAKQSLSEPEAFKWIQRAAMDRRTTMKAVAQVVVETLGPTT